MNIVVESLRIAWYLIMLVLALVGCFTWSKALASIGLGKARAKQEDDEIEDRTRDTWKLDFENSMKHPEKPHWINQLHRRRNVIAIILILTVITGFFFFAPYIKDILLL